MNETTGVGVATQTTVMSEAHVSGVLSMVSDLVQVAGRGLEESSIPPYRKQFILRDFTSTMRTLRDVVRMCPSDDTRHGKFQLLLDSLEIIRSALATDSTPRERRAHVLLDVKRHDGPGRPSFDIAQELLTDLAACGYNQTEMANILGVSRKLIWLRCQHFGIVLNPIISDNVLRQAIDQARHDLPFSGIVFIREELIRKGLKVSRARVEVILREQDPEGTIRRWSRTIARRVYSVAGPMALWHIDGHDSIRTHDVIHCNPAWIV
jgi:hypothetical protein